MRARSIFLQVIIGIFIIFVIFIKFDINDVVFVLKKTDYIFFILACISYLFLNFVLAGRLDYLLTKIGYKPRYPTVFLSHMGGMIVGDLTPGRSGYFLTPPILKKNTGTKITDGMACIFAPQGIEFILKVGGAIAAIFYISSRSPIRNDVLISVSIGAILLLIVGILMLMISWRDEELTSKIVRKLPFFKNFTDKVSFFKERSTQIKSSLNAILILYMIGWVFAGLQWFYLGKALGIQLPFFCLFSAPSIDNYIDVCTHIASGFWDNGGRSNSCLFIIRNCSSPRTGFFNFGKSQYITCRPDRFKNSAVIAPVFRYYDLMPTP